MDVMEKDTKIDTGILFSNTNAIVQAIDFRIGSSDP